MGIVRVLSVTFGLALGVVTRLGAQPLQFRHYGVDEGLPSSLVSAILQDRHGFMWIGSARGLARFDGLKFRVYRAHPDSASWLPEALVDRLLADRAGRLWVVTTAGVSRYDARIDGFRTYRAESMLRDIPAAARRGWPPRVEATAILEDRAGRILVGTNAGVYRLDTLSGRGTPIPLASSGVLGDRHVTALYEDRAGALWVATQGGLARRSSADATSGGATPVRWFTTRSAEGPALPHDFVRALAEDGRGRLWIGTQGGVVLLDTATATFTRVPLSRVGASTLPARIASLVPDRNGASMWIGTEQSGVAHVDLRTGTITRHLFNPSQERSLSSNSVWALHQDRSGLLWVGTFSGGLNVSARDGLAIRHFRNVPTDPASLSYNAVPAFAESADGALWVATDGGGLNRFDARTGRFDHYTTANSTLNVDAVLSMATDRRGVLWLSTWGGGISRFDARATQFRAFTTRTSDIPHDNVYEVLVDRRDSVWVGTDNGMLAMLDRASGRFPRRFSVVAPGTDVSSVLMLRELRDGRFAVAKRNGGVTLVDPQTARQVHLLASGPSGQRLSSNAVRAVAEDEGTLWIGTARGLDRLDLTSLQVTSMDSIDVLGNASVEGLVLDARRRLWISTDAGLIRFDPRSGNTRTYTKSEGLQGNEFLMRSAFRSRNGTLFFGGNNGFNTIATDKLVEGRDAPPVVFTNLLVGNKPTRAGAADSPLTRVVHELRELTLTPKQNVVTIEYAALDYDGAEHTAYEYQLEGFDAEWQSVGTQRAATYTNLPPGVYTFRARLVDDMARPTPSVAALDIRVLAPWWRTWWFRVLVLLSSAAALARLWRFQQQRRLEIALGNQALHDTLTGLANRALFRERVSHALARLDRQQGRAARLGVPDVGAELRTPRIAVLFLDLDNFKTVNDTLGHHAGDVLLKVVADRLRDATRDTDTVARFGGDEFAVLLEDMAGASDAHLVADRIVASISVPVNVGTEAQQKEAFVGVSVGIAFAGMGLPLDTETLMRHADTAMYRAKHDGKGRRAVFDTDMESEALEVHDLQQSLGQAITRGEMRCVYQPIVSLDTGEMLGAETLVRWTHPVRGVIPPDRFIPYAEQSGFIVELGDWVLREACREAASWPVGADGSPLCVSVNVSVRQFLHPEFPEQVRAALTAAALEPTRLALEISERHLVIDVDESIAALTKLKALGIRLAIDDFGSGHSSLQYLQRFPVDALKIDRAFVAALDMSTEDTTLVGMIIALGDSVRLRVMAEGIETRGQHETLLQLGCSAGQGYLFARPVEGELIRRGNAMLRSA